MMMCAQKHRDNGVDSVGISEETSWRKDCNSMLYQREEDTQKRRQSHTK